MSIFDDIRSKISPASNETGEQKRKMEMPGQEGAQGAGENMAKDLNEIPLEHVINLRNQGMSNNQIIQNLQREGYTIDKINNAINQANIKEGIVSTPFQMQGQGNPGGNPGNPKPPQEGSSSGPPPTQGVPSGAPPPMTPPPGAGAQQGGFSETSEERLQEIAEAIIDEKWQHLSDNINRIIDWKGQVDTKIGQMEQSMKDLKDSFERLHEGVLGKISDYDKSMTNIGTEIKALEKVFQKILPGFMENVSELSRITDKMKKSKEKKS